MRYKPEISRLSRIQLLTLTIAVLFSSHTVSADVGSDYIEQWGITWTFDKNLSTDGPEDTYQYGTFANGDYWVVIPAGGRVNITEITPQSETGPYGPDDGGQRTIHGSMINPDPTYPQGAEGRPKLKEQGWDSYLYANTTFIYNADLNVALGISSQSPLSITEPSSLVSVESLPMNQVVGKRRLRTAAVLTFLSKTPPPNSFRPSYVGTDKSIRYSTSDIAENTFAEANGKPAILKKVEPAGTPPSWETVNRYFERMWLDMSYHDFARYSHPLDNMPDYGREMAREIGTAALMLNMNYPNQDKQHLLIRFLQYGIDLWGVVETGYIGWPQMGGHGPGRKFPILFAGIILGDEDMAAIGQKDPLDWPYFGEDQTVMYLTEFEAKRYLAEITDPGDPDYNNPDWPIKIEVDGEMRNAKYRLNNGLLNTHRDYPDAYYTEADWTFVNPNGEIGIPEFVKTNSKLSPEQGRWISRRIDASYRRSGHAHCFVGYILATYIMDLKHEWNHDALFDYMDRYLAWSSDVYGPTDYRVFWSRFHRDMWNTYRANYGPIWPDQSGNQRPTANATMDPDGEITDDDGNGVEQVSLDGSASTDNDGNIVSWVWTDSLGDSIPDGEVVAATLSVGEHIITLTVTDDAGASDTDTVPISIVNSGGVPDPDDGLVYFKTSASSFNGIDSFVQIPTSGMNADGGTIALSAYAEDLSVSRYLFGHTVGTWSNRIQLYITDGDLRLGLGGTHSRHAEIATFSTHSWRHVALSWNGTEYAVYVDGLEKATGAYSGLTQLNDFADIGNTGNPSWRDQEAFSGVIDDIRIYNRALNANEVLELYNSGSDNPTHSVTASAQAGGSITPDGTVQLAEGVDRTFIITPQTGYHIADVLVDGSSVGTVGSYTFANITGNHTISATFALTQVTHTIQASAGTGGSISPNGTTTINQGRNQRFTITPATGYHIANVLVDGSSVGVVGSYTFSNITGNHTISATFSLDTYTITATAQAGATISPGGNIQVQHGSSRTFIITAQTGYHITDVMVDGQSMGETGSYTFTNITSDHTLAANAAANQTDISPVAWYKFNEGYGNSAQDSSGIGNTGALAGAVWTIEDGLSFDGTDDYVEVPDSDSLDIQNEITLSLWVKLNTYDTDWPKLITKPYQSYADPWELYALDLGHYGNTPRLIITDGIPGGETAGAANTNYTLSLSKWHHIAGTYDGSLMSVYVDGDLIATQAANFQIGTNDMPLSIGGRLGVNSFNGLIDNVRIYNRALTGQEVIELYKLNTLKGRWKLDTYSGLNSPDSSENDNTATLTNGPLWTGAGELKLDGVDDHVDCGSGASSNLTGDLTVTAWVCPENFGANGLGRIVDKGDVNSGFAFYVRESTRSIAYLIYGGDVIVSDFDVIDLAQWQHVAITYSDTSHTVAFYVNGQPAGGGIYQTNPNDSVNAPLIIGNRAASDRGFKGMLSDVRIYSRALDSEEIAAIYYTYEVTENKPLAFELSATDSEGNVLSYVAQDPATLPDGATFTDSIFTWRPWYDQADTYEITFEVPDQPDLTVPMVVEDVSLKPYYRRFLETNGKY